MYLYRTIIAKRIEDDYQDFVEIDIEEARMYLNEAAKFISRVAEYIAHNSEID